MVRRGFGPRQRRKPSCGSDGRTGKVCGDLAGAGQKNKTGVERIVVCVEGSGRRRAGELWQH